MKERKKIKRIMGLVILFEVLLVLILICLIRDKENPKRSNSTSTLNESYLMNSKGKIIVYKYKEKITYKQGELLSKHTITNINSSNNRNTNMKIAANIINSKSNNTGFILKPGKIFSWLKVVGNTTTEKGFKIAPIIINGQHAEGLGGGVCQVASTINSVIIKAGLKTNSQKHSASVGYLGPNDYEATVSYDSGKDLSFKNTFNYPIKIKVIAKGGSVTVKIFKMKKEIEVIKYQ